MKKSSQIAGLCGIVLLLFGLAEFLFSQAFSLYTITHFTIGAGMVLFSLIFNFGGVWSSLGARSTRYSANAVLYSIIFLTILVLVNWMANKHSWRKDLTEAGLFSLSSQSQKILKNLEAEVEVLAFFQESKGTRLEDLLRNYAHTSPLFSYQFVDPVKHPEKAKAFEVNSSDILVVKSREQNTKIVGITEEDITNAILKVTKHDEKKIYFLTGHGEPDVKDEEESGFQYISKALENERYVIESLKLYMQKDVPADCSVLVVAAPEKVLEQTELDAIERYLNKGGDSLFLMDPTNSKGLDKFVKKWGVEVGNNIVVDQVLRLFYGPSLGVDPVVENFGDHKITAEFEGQTLFHLARSVDVAQDLPDGVTAVSLAKASENSWGETDLDRFYEKSEVSQSLEDLAGPVSIAVALTAKTEETAGTNSQEGAETDTSRQNETKMVVFGDSDFATNQYLIKMYNGDLLLNVFDWLAGEEEMISIRPKTSKGSKVAMTPQQTRDIFYMSVLILPEILLLLGLAIWWRRR